MFFASCKRRVLQRRLALSALAVVFSVPLAFNMPAKAEWPERPITLVSCFPPAGATDVAARLLNTPLGDALGKPVVVENRAGASGMVGTQAVARAAPDGYTLLLCSSVFVVNPSLYSSAAYDPIKDFEPVTVLGASPNVFVVSGQSEIKTMTEFIDKAKAAPGKMNWSTPGPGTTPHLGGEHLKMQTGIQMAYVPFTGGGPATQAIIAGQIDLLAANLGTFVPQIEAGLIRPIATTSKDRWPTLPNVPTLYELGFKDAISDTFLAIWVPAGTPKPIITRLHKEIAAVLARSDIADRYAKAGVPVVAEGPDMFRERIQRELTGYKAIIDKAGLRK